jgi:hypothetical protein
LLSESKAAETIMNKADFLAKLKEKRQKKV